MLPGQERLYLGAVSLNNSAVLLAERGRYRQALTVLRDSMFAMREAQRARMTPCVGAAADRSDMKAPTPGSAIIKARGARRAQEALGLEGLLRRASRFAMDSASAPAAAAPRAFRVDVPVEAHLLDADVPRFAMTGGGGGGHDPSAASASTALALIRIDAAPALDFSDAATATDEDGSQEAEADLEAVAVLHNFGVLALLLPFEERRLRRIAATINGLALDYLQRGSLRAAGGDPNWTIAALRLSSMVARCGSRLHADLGNAEEAWRALTLARAAHAAAAEAEAARQPHLADGLSSPHAKAA